MALYEVIGAVCVVGFSTLLVFLFVRLIRGHHDGKLAWATLGRTTLARFRYGGEQWRRFLRLEAAAHLQMFGLAVVVVVLVMFALVIFSALFLKGSIAEFLRTNAGWLSASILAAGLGAGAIAFLYEATTEHLLRWMVTPSKRAEVLIFSTGIVIAGAAIPWSTPNHSLLSVTVTPDRDLLVFELERREPQESGGDLWVPRTLRLPIPPGVDVTPVVAGVDLSPRHKDACPPAEG